MAIIAGDLSLELAQKIREAGPWGQGFPEPLFDGFFEILEQRIVGERHLKLRLKPDDSSFVLEAIAFSQTALCASSRIRAIYRLDINDYRGSKSLQLVIESLETVDQGPGAGVR